MFTIKINKDRSALECDPTLRNLNKLNRHVGTLLLKNFYQIWT